MSDAKIKVIIKRPDEKAGHVTNISASLKNLQKTVEGNIETVTVVLDPKVIMICNEDVDQEAADRERDQMAAYTKVCGFEYYATLDQVMQSDIYLIDPAGLIRLKRILDDRKLPVRLVVILLEVTEEIRRQRLLIRDGKLDEDRLRWDTEEFDRDLKPVLRTFPDLITLWNTRPLTETLDRLYERLEERRRAGLRFEHEPVAEAW